MNPPGHEIILGQKVLRIDKRQPKNKRWHPTAEASLLCRAYRFYGPSCALHVALCVFFVRSGDAPVLLSKGELQSTVKWSRHFSYLVYNLLIPKIMFSRSRLMSVIHLVSPDVDLQMNSWIVLAWRHIDTEVVRSTTHIPTWIATLLLFVFLNLQLLFYYSWCEISKNTRRKILCINHSSITSHYNLVLS